MLNTPEVRLDQRIPPEIRPLVQDFSNRLNVELNGLITALYLEGSIALGGFDPRLSDIDFAAVLSRKVSNDDIDKILNIHKNIEQIHPGWKISGWYYQPGDLLGMDHPSQPIFYLHDGKLIRSIQFGLSLVTWWILNHRGVTLFGPPPQSLSITVDINDLLKTQRENLNSYWARWPTRPGRFLSLFSDRGIQWMVLGMLRQFYTICEHEITLKITAGEYALTSLPERWHRIIREAVALREDPRRSRYRWRINRMIDALRFHKYMIRLCNDMLARGNVCF